MGVYGFPAGTLVDGRIRWYADHRETWRHQIARLPPLPANGKVMVTHDTNDPIEGFGGFEADEWPALAFARMYGDDDGAFDAVTATDSFRRLAPGFDPQWAIFPPGDVGEEDPRRQAGRRRSDVHVSGRAAWQFQH